jgi:hypothetical protein
VARIRTIKPEIWEDELFGNLSRDAQLMFIGLISQADDDGRQRGAAALFRSALWPYDPPELGDVEGWLTELLGTGMVVQYEADRQTYLQICNWEKHQRVQKRTPSKLPPPPLRNIPADGGKTPEAYRNSSKPASESQFRNFPEDSGTDQEGDQDQEGDHSLSARAREPIDSDFADAVTDFWLQWPTNRRDVSDMRLGDLLIAAGVMTGFEMIAVRDAFAEDQGSSDWRDGVIPNLSTWVDRKPWLRPEQTFADALAASEHPADRAAARHLKAINGGGAA